MLLIDIRSTNASAAEFILYRLKLYLAGRHHHHRFYVQPDDCIINNSNDDIINNG